MTETVASSAPSDPPFAHADSLSYVVWDVATRTQALGEKALSSTPLSMAGSGVLDHVSVEPGVTIAAIARRVPKSAQAISQVVARLEKLGLLERRLVGGRSIGLFITDAGTAAHDSAGAAQDAFDARLEAAIGLRETEQLRGMLHRVRAALVEVGDDH